MPKKKTNGESKKTKKTEEKPDFQLPSEQRLEIQVSNDTIARLKMEATELRMDYLERERSMYQQINTAKQTLQNRLIALAQPLGVDFQNGTWTYLPKTGKFVPKQQ